MTHFRFLILSVKRSSRNMCRDFVSAWHLQVPSGTYVPLEFQKGLGSALEWEMVALDIFPSWLPPYFSPPGCLPICYTLILR